MHSPPFTKSRVFYINLYILYTIISLEYDKKHTPHLQRHNLQRNRITQSFIEPTRRRIKQDGPIGACVASRARLPQSLRALSVLRIVREAAVELAPRAHRRRGAVPVVKEHGATVVKLEVSERASTLDDVEGVLSRILEDCSCMRISSVYYTRVSGGKDTNRRGWLVRSRGAAGCQS